MSYLYSDRVRLVVYLYIVNVFETDNEWHYSLLIACEAWIFDMKSVL